MVYGYVFLGEYNESQKLAIQKNHF